MKIITKSLLAASIALSGISVSGAAVADPFKGPQTHVQKIAYKGDRNRGGENWNRGGSRKNWKKGRGRNNHRRGRGVGNVVLGVGLGYLMFGGNNHRDHYVDRHVRYDRHYYEPRRAPRYVEVEREVIYRDRPTYRETVQGARGNEFKGAECLQIREYQTIIVIGGEEQEAYGDACLQPDGSWIQGSPKTVPNYN